jgi:hypothetical protein
MFCHLKQASKTRKEINMNNWKLNTIGISILMTALLSLADGSAFAADGVPLTPEMAAKKETFRRQNEQKVTNEKRKAAVEALKAERIKVYRARQAKAAAGQSTQISTDK